MLCMNSQGVASWYLYLSWIHLRKRTFPRKYSGRPVTYWQMLYYLPTYLGISDLYAYRLAWWRILGDQPPHRRCQVFCICNNMLSLHACIVIRTNNISHMLLGGVSFWVVLVCSLDRLYPYAHAAFSNWFSSRWLDNKAQAGGKRKVPQPQIQPPPLFF